MTFYFHLGGIKFLANNLIKWTLPPGYECYLENEKLLSPEKKFFDFFWCWNAIWLAIRNDNVCAHYLCHGVEYISLMVKEQDAVGGASLAPFLHQGVHFFWNVQYAVKLELHTLRINMGRSLVGYAQLWNVAGTKGSPFLKKGFSMSF